RWSPSFDGWKIIEPQCASPGFVEGDIAAGEWTLEICALHLVSLCTIEIAVEYSNEKTNHIPELRIYQTEDEIPDEEAPSSWMIGELFETTTRSSGARSVNQTIAAYQKQDCGFLALADENLPPIEKFSIDPGFSVLRAQSLHTPDGTALLLGARERIDWRDEDSAKPLFSLVRETHIAGGLFCVAEPFAAGSTWAAHSWLSNEECLPLIDLLHIWPGTWKMCFPEIQKAMRTWDALLNQGHRIYGIAGKGPQISIASDEALEVPKTVVYSQAQGETALLSALKQGRFFATLEPAISIWTESAYGGAMMGDEMRLPLDTPYLLYVSITQMDKGGYFTIRTNDGIYCQTPYSIRKDTTFKLFVSAHKDYQWFRLEVYRFGRPFDSLIAFSNPIFIRSFISS
ncbi:CehA/McbA family metallohydrolase, partial [bacterium]|nr:CehA/McbA family metallohydrolase [bacterium]